MNIKFVHYVCWCDTQIGGFPPIFTDKTHRQLEKKYVKKSADFFFYNCRPIFLSVVISFGGTQALGYDLYGGNCVSEFVKMIRIVTRYERFIADASDHWPLSLTQLCVTDLGGRLGSNYVCLQK